MYGIFTYIYHKDPPNVSKYSIHGARGYASITPATTEKNTPSPHCFQVFGPSLEVNRVAAGEAAGDGSCSRKTKSKQKIHENPLGGGFKYFLLSPLLGEDSHFDQPEKIPPSPSV